MFGEILGRNSETNFYVPGSLKNANIDIVCLVCVRGLGLEELVSVGRARAPEMRICHMSNHSQIYWGGRHGNPFSQAGVTC